MQVATAQSTVELSWSVQSALAAGVAVACGGVAITFRRPAIRALAITYLLVTLASVAIWASLTASARGLSDASTALLVSLSLPFTPVLAFLYYRQILLLLAGTATDAMPPLIRVLAVGIIALIVSFGTALATISRGPVVVAMLGTAAMLVGLVWLFVIAERGRRTPGAQRWPLLMFQWSFTALAVRSGVNVVVAAMAFMNGHSPTFTLGTTVAQAFLMVVAAALQLVAVLDEEREHSLRQAEQLRKAELAVAASQRLESLGRMAGIVAHDFNNVLSVISMSAQAVTHEKGDVEDEELREILASARRGQALTAQLLAFAKQEPQRVSRFDARAQVAQLRSVLERMAGKAVTVEIISAESLQLVDMEVTQFEQIVINLVVNARDAMPAGGTVSIRVGDDSAPPGEMVPLSVSDTGAGIPADVMPHIFEPFYSTKQQGEGTGLGLAICNGIIVRAGGRIEVDSKPGQGTRFDVFIPRSSGT